MLTLSEENYLKAIYHLSSSGSDEVSTSQISEYMQTKPASVSDMIKRLAEKKLISYKKYQGVNITEQGKYTALSIVRKHRLWEVFLVEKLKFHWDEVHEVAEQLEHIKSPLLIKRLDEFLEFPRIDPHGDPIPDANGEIKIGPQEPLESIEPGASVYVMAVNDSDPDLLKYLDKVGIYLGAKIKVLERVAFDDSIEVLVDQQKKIFLSKKVSENIQVSK